MKRTSNIIWGVFLIGLGLLFLVNRYFQLDIFRIQNIWPLFVLIPGLMFELSFFVSRKDPGLLVPGGILTTIGALFIFETMTNFRFAGSTWPVYPFAVAVGLFQLYLFSGREPALLIPVGILGGVSLIAFLSIFVSWFNLSLIFPFVLIILGLYIALRRK